MGIDVSLSDTDVVWTKSPAQLFARNSGMYSQVADVLVTSDCLSQNMAWGLLRASTRRMLNLPLLLCTYL